MISSIKKFLKQKEDILFLGGSTLFVSSVFFLFGPLQLYIVNITEMWFSIGSVLWPSVLVFLFVFLVLSAIGILLYRWKKIFYGYLALLCGLGIALYIQGNILPFPYGILNGESVDWSKYSHEIVVSGLVWAFCLVVPIVLVFAVPSIGKKILRYGAVGMTAVQLVALAGLCLTVDFSKSAVSDTFLSDKGLFEVGDEQNVIIFVLDYFDESYLEAVYAEDPVFLEFLDGFTCFTDAMSAYLNTRGSLPYLLTGQRYKNEQPYDAFISEAWENASDRYGLLQDQNYDVSIYTHLETAVSENAKRTLISNAVESPLSVSNPVAFEGSFLQFTAMRFFPDAVKKYIWNYNNLFERYKVSEKITEEPFVWEESIFYQRLKTENLSLKKGKKFKFIHLDGTHPPYSVMEDLAEDDSRASEVTEAKGSLNIVREYIRQLKELGVYDKTSMIVLADHGKISPYPIFMAKPFNNNSDLVYSDKPVSHDDFWGTVAKETGIEIPGQSVFDKETGLDTERICYRFLVDGVREWVTPYFPDMYEYRAARDEKIKMLVPTGNIYTQNGVKTFTPYYCKIGEPIHFNERDIQASSYFSFSEYSAVSDEEHLWAQGHYGRACFHVGNLEEDLLCHIEIFNWVPRDKQRVFIKSEGILLYDGIVTSGMTGINFSIPKSCLSDGFIVLDFEFPDADSPRNLGGNPQDNRVISIGFREILFEEQSQTKQISFGRNGQALPYIYDGWHSLEEQEQACWTNETARVIAVLPGETDYKMQVSYFSNPAAGETKVYYNDAYIGTLPHIAEGSFQTVELLLPAAYRSGPDAQRITLVTEGATLYRGTGPDPRILGINVSEMQFEAVGQ